jgi:hypothetical protein
LPTTVESYTSWLMSQRNYKCKRNSVWVCEGLLSVRLLLKALPFKIKLKRRDAHTWTERHTKKATRWDKYVTHVIVLEPFDARSASSSDVETLSWSNVFQLGCATESSIEHLHQKQRCKDKSKGSCANCFHCRRTVVRWQRSYWWWSTWLTRWSYNKWSYISKVLSIPCSCVMDWVGVTRDVSN